MRIYKRKNRDGKPSPNYCYAFSIKGIRYRGSCYTSNKHEALVFVENIRKKAFEQQILNIKNPTFAQAATYYLKNNKKELENLSKARKSQYKLTLQHALEFFNDKDFNAQNMYKFISHIETTRNLSKNTVTKYIDPIRSITKFCTAQGEMESNFILKMDFSSYTAEKRKIRYRFLSKAEYQNLNDTIAQYKPEIWDFFYFALNTGLRLGEQLDLTWDRVNLGEKSIYIDKTKTDRPRKLTLHDPKLIEILHARSHLQQPFKIPKGTLHSSWVIALQKANIEDFRWHDLRHTFASWAIMGWHTWQQAPMPVTRLQRYLGHTKLDMTMRYAHLVDEC